MSLALRCKRWGALPVQGAMLDQPAEVMLRMESCLNVYDAYSSYLNKGELSTLDWAERYPALEEVYLAVEELRSEDG